MLFIIIILVVVLIFIFAMIFFNGNSVPPDMLYPCPWENERRDNKMISAEDVRKQLEQNQKSQIAKEIESIEQKILGATAKGENRVYIEPAISTGAKQMLKQLGYKVEYHSQYNDDYTSIEW